MSTFQDREILTSAQNKGRFPTLLAFLRLSGPGWLQSAITLGGGSLVGALYLGMLGGTQMLWLQLVAIVIGVIMLAAISYITLSTGQHPYEAINDHVNPVLGVGWVTATILANMIWIISQFSLCFDALDSNLIPNGLGDDYTTKALVSAVIAVLALGAVIMSFNPGVASRIFDLFLKLTIMVVLLCFVGVVVYLTQNQTLNWSEIFAGFIPDFSLWNHPSNQLTQIASQLDQETNEYWTDKIVGRQKESMISVTATAVGLNMTFLFPYSMLVRGWDKPFRGLARFDLITALAIPFIIVTSCIVIASANAFHGKADAYLLSNDSAEVQKSVLFKSLLPIAEKRMEAKGESNELTAINREISILKQQVAGASDDTSIDAAKDLLKEAEKNKADLIATVISQMQEEERVLAAAMVKPNVAQLSATLEPIFGENQNWSKLLLGIGALGMGFSTIIILSLINSLAVAEIWGNLRSFWARTIGAAAAVLTGFFWFLIWSSGSKTYLVIAASTFGAILLPIAYFSFFVLMNSKRCLGEEKPTGSRLWIWNILMGIGVIGAIAQAYGGVSTKINDPVAGPLVIGGAVTFLLLALVGFSARPQYDYEDESEKE